MLLRWKWILGIGIANFLLLTLAGGTWLVEVPYFLAFGWISYSRRVLPNVEFDWATIGFALAAMGLFTVGLHLFLSWLAAAINAPDSGRASINAAEQSMVWKPRWTVAVVSLALLLFVAGIAFVGVVHQVTWLARSPIPLLESGVHSAALRNQSMNQLKWMALAALNKSEVQDSVATTATIVHDRPVHSWQTELLPFLEQASLYDRVQRDLPWNHAKNLPAFSTIVETYESPYSNRRGLLPHDKAGYALTDYAANERVVKDGRAIDFQGMTDGATHTLLYGETFENRWPWGKPGNVHDPADGINSSPNGFSGDFGARGANFSFADGHASFLSEDIDPQVLKALSTPAGGERINSDAASD